MAGLVPDAEEGRSHLFFVTEGEASPHFCLQSGLVMDPKQVRLNSKF